MTRTHWENADQSRNRSDINGVDPLGMCGDLGQQRPLRFAEDSNVTRPKCSDNKVRPQSHWRARISTQHRNIGSCLSCNINTSACCMVRQLTTYVVSPTPIAGVCARRRQLYWLSDQCGWWPWAFAVAGSQLWNSLLHDITYAPTLPVSAPV